MVSKYNKDKEPLTKKETTNLTLSLWEVERYKYILLSLDPLIIITIQEWTKTMIPSCFKDCHCFVEHFFVNTQ